jgi:hypothetical protein
VADTRTYVAYDVQQMAAILGFSMYEIENVWTDELLAANMRDYYAGRLTDHIVDPSQAVHAEDVNVASQFLKMTGEDLSNAASSVVSAGKSLLPTLSLGLIAIIGITAFLLFRK